MAKRYVTMIDPSDRAELCDDDMGADESCALEVLADKEFLAKVLLRLSPREERVIRLRFGLGGVGEHTLHEIGEELGIGVESVRRVQNKALRRLRWHACRVFPDRAKRAGITALPKPVPPTPVQGPGPQTSRAENSAGRTVRDKSRKPAFRPPTTQPTTVAPVPTLTSGWLLFAVICAYLAALGINSTVSYQVATVLGAPLAWLVPWRRDAGRCHQPYRADQPRS
jgi:RNA polymerase primary sigma factor